VVDRSEDRRWCVGDGLVLSVIDSVIDSVVMKVKSKEVGKDDFTYNELSY
jgi:hypothetical protein